MGSSVCAAVMSIQASTVRCRVCWPRSTLWRHPAPNLSGVLYPVSCNPLLSERLVSCRLMINLAAAGEFIVDVDPTAAGKVHD